MKTDDLIRALAVDAVPRRQPVSMAAIALVLATVVAAAVFFSTLGIRPDFGSAAQTLRFLFKFVVTLTLAASAFLVLFRLSLPGASYASALRLLLAAPVLLTGAVLFELAVTPSASWEPRLIGTNARLCLTFIPLIAIGPLITFLFFLRNNAPTRPMLSGAVAGLVAGGLAATFYAAHCPDDSPLFVAVWYSLAIAILTFAGALIGRSALRW